jgi:hypothetical protein
MNFGYDSLIGISAAFLTTLSFIPQIIKAQIINSKELESLVETAEEEHLISLIYFYFNFAKFGGADSLVLFASKRSQSSFNISGQHSLVEYCTLAANK